LQKGHRLLLLTYCNGAKFGDFGLYLAQKLVLIGSGAELHSDEMLFEALDWGHGRFVFGEIYLLCKMLF